MIEQLESVMLQIGQGLSAQHIGEMSATVEQIDRRSQNFQLAGGQGRIILIASTDPLGPAFDFVVDLAKQMDWKVAFVAQYSPRPGTAAWRIYKDEISPQEKKRRWEILDKIINKDNLKVRPKVVS